MPRKSIYDGDRLGRIAREQFGVIGRSQALDCGVSRSAVGYLLRQDGPYLSPEDYARTTARHNHMTAYGINLLRFLPSMLRQEPSTVIDDLRGAITRGNSRPPLPIVTVPAAA
jgi:hypothetical protein